LRPAVAQLGVKCVCRTMPDVVAQRLDHRLVGHPQTLVGTPPQHHGAIAVGRRSQLGR
jgi:hypothetical protein